MLDITAIGAHPDDIEIFAYGLLAACRTRGDRLSLIIASDGAKGAVGADGDADGEMGKTLASRRADEAIEGLKLLGVPQFLGLPDGGIADAPDAPQLIRDAITASKPDLIITHAPEDYHPDHRALAMLVGNAASFKVPILCADTLMGVGFAPQFYIDITLYAAEKDAAILAHHSQRPERFVAAARLTNRFRAAQCNAPEPCRAEAYRSDARFPFADIRGLLPPAPPLKPFYQGLDDAFI